MAASLYTCYTRIASICCQNSRCVYSPFLRSKRLYARSIKRTPLAIRSPEEDLQKLIRKGVKMKDPKENPFLPFVTDDPTQNQLTKPRDQNRHSYGKPVTNVSSKNKHWNKHSQKPAVVASVATKNITSSGLQFEKLQDGDRRFGQVLMATKSAKQREKEGLILLEGRRLILDSLHTGVQLKYLYFTDTSLVTGLPVEFLKDAALYKVQYRHLKQWATTQTPAGIIGVFVKPDTGEVVFPQHDTLPITLICDNIREPGNMGTIIRTAAAIGCKKIITTKGCVDVWDPKVLRGGMGGHFYTCVLNNIPWEQIVNYVPLTSPVFIADSRKTSHLEKSFDISHPKVIDLLTTGKPDTDSSSSSDEESGDSEQESSDEEVEENDDSEHSELTWSNKRTEMYKSIPLSVVQYTDVDCKGAEEVTVIVGGETAGVSPQAKKFAFDRYGQYITIPMAEAVDSLNSGVAAAVVLYEVRKQMSVNEKSSQRRLPHVPAKNKN